MLEQRLIPCLLLRDGGLVKTVNFRDEKYVGDPINAVRIFNEKQADELIVLDIGATATGQAIDFDLLEKISVECRMPLCYGGGVKSIEDFERIIEIGVEKVAIGSSAFTNQKVVSEAVRRFGRQSVVAVLDYKAPNLFKRSEVLIKNGTQSTGLEVIEAGKFLASLGVGEIVLQSIDRDGTSKGFDTTTVRQLAESVEIPITALGGMGSIRDLIQLRKHCGLVGAAGGSYFVFHGKYRAVLIKYPTHDERKGCPGA